MIKLFFDSQMVKALTLFLLLQVVLAGVQAQQPGQLDYSFSPAQIGTVSNSGVVGGEVNTIGAQPNGKVVLGGRFIGYDGVIQNNIARLDVNGRLDISFGESLRLTELRKLWALPDGKIIVSRSENGELLRLSANGQVDSSFVVNNGVTGSFTSLALLDNQKIVIAGSFITSGDQNNKRIARLNADGSLDASFQSSSAFDYGFIATLVVQEDGKIIVGGNFQSFNGVACNGIIRLNSDGTIDTDFNPIIRPGYRNTVRSLALQLDGKIIVSMSGYSIDTGTDSNSIERLNTDGSNDGSFFADSYINAQVLVQPDDKTIVYHNYGIVRLNKNGDLDTSFNIGRGIKNSHEYGAVVGIVLQEDGKIIICGAFSSIDGIRRNKIGRLNADGSLDLSFDPGTGGSVTPLSANIYAICQQMDGKIIMGGGFTRCNGVETNGIARFKLDGSLDPDFKTGVEISDIIAAVVQQADGKIIIGGAFTSYSGINKNYIARLNEDGSLDMTFNSDVGANGPIYAVAVQPDNKILVGGNFTHYNGVRSHGIARLNADGSLDSRFSPGGSLNAPVLTIALQDNGRVIVGGFFTKYGDQNSGHVARLNSNGSLDTDFVVSVGTDGPVYTALVQADGNIVVGGEFIKYQTNYSRGIARIKPDGHPDFSFDTGSGLLVTVDNTTRTGFANTLVLQANQKLIVGGNFTNYDNTAQNGLLRLNTDGKIDSTFGAGTGTDGPVWIATLLADESVLIAGGFTSYNDNRQDQVAKIYGGELAITSVTGDVLTDRVTVYPNPFASDFYVHLPHASVGELNLELLSITGNRLYATSYMLAPGSQTLPIKLQQQMLPAGVYVLRLQQGGKSYIYRLIKE